MRGEFVPGEASSFEHVPTHIPKCHQWVIIHFIENAQTDIFGPFVFSTHTFVPRCNHDEKYDHTLKYIFVRREQNFRYKLRKLDPPLEERAGKCKLCTPFARTIVFSFTTDRDIQKSQLRPIRLLVRRSFDIVWYEQQIIYTRETNQISKFS